MINDFDFSPESFGLRPERQERRPTGIVLLFTCGILTLLAVIACCCCLVLMVLAMREPLTLASLWGGALESRDGYILARAFTCENSAARRLTNELESQGAYFSAFEVGAEVDGDGVRVAGILNTNGTPAEWRAVIYIADGGTFGKCINRIDVDN